MLWRPQGEQLPTVVCASVQGAQFQAEIARQLAEKKARPDIPEETGRLQTLGTYQSDHVAPPSAVLQLLNGSGYQQALGQNPYYAPQSFQYTLPDIFFQLDALGESADACSATESL